MSFQIRHIVLYGPVDEPRILDFNLGKLNIITGASNTGKSALISIVDYCLGAKTCKVARGPIRDTVEWYGVVLEKTNQQLSIFRQAPAHRKKQNTVCAINISNKIQIPRKNDIVANTDIDTAKQIISNFAGINDYIHKPPDGQTRDPITVTIRHSLYFCFQTQNEISSQKLLFHRQSDPYIPQAIKDVLPYFLGAIDDSHFGKTLHRRKLQTQLRKFQRQREESKRIDSDSNKSADLLAEATRIGLVDLPDYSLTPQMVTDFLKATINQPKESASADLDMGLSKYEELMNERQQLTRKLRLCEFELKEAKALLFERSAFLLEGSEQAGRLRSINLFPKEHQENICPFCQSLVPGIPALVDLRNALDTVTDHLQQIHQENPHLERIIDTIDRKRQEIKSSILDNYRAVNQLQRSSRIVANYRDSIEKAAHVRGRISMFLETTPIVSEEADLILEKSEQLKKEIELLDKELDLDVVQDRVDTLLDLVSQKLTVYAKRLDLEYSKHTLRLSLKDLTIIADEPAGATPMEEMGGGSNWVGFHIVAYLALHELFAEGGRPVPRFVFLDQPSQTKFPADVDVTGKLQRQKKGDLDEERADVLDMLKLVDSAVKELNGALQIVLMEHADLDDKWYQDLVVERWRDGSALIPKCWIEIVESRSHR